MCQHLTAFPALRCQFSRASLRSDDVERWEGKRFKINNYIVNPAASASWLGGCQVATPILPAIKVYSSARTEHNADSISIFCFLWGECLFSGFSRTPPFFQHKKNKRNCYSRGVPRLSIPVTQLVKMRMSWCEREREIPSVTQLVEVNANVKFHHSIP